MNSNARLKHLIRLDHNVKVVVPGTIDVDQQSDNQQYVDRTVGQLSQWFGGATAYNARGGWFSNGRVVYERVTVVESFASDLEPHIDSLIDLCLTLKAELTQEAIALEIDGELYLV